MRYMFTYPKNKHVCIMSFDSMSECIDFVEKHQFITFYVWNYDASAYYDMAHDITGFYEYYYNVYKKGILQ